MAAEARRDGGEVAAEARRDGWGVAAEARRRRVVSSEAWTWSERTGGAEVGRGRSESRRAVGCPSFSMKPGRAQR